MTPFDYIRLSLWLLVGVGAAFWLRKELTPARFLTIFQSEGVLSTRLILGFAVVAYCMTMDAAGHMANSRLETWLLFAGSLIGLGIAKVVGKAIAATPSTQIKSDSTKVEADKVVLTDTSTTPPAGPPAE